MAISKKISKFMEKGSWIRKMFEDGIRLKKEFGAENVQDLTLGNPVLEPPQELVKRLKALVSEPEEGMHRYMPNAGYEWVREKIAEFYINETDCQLTAKHIIMTCGAAGGVNVTLKTLLDAGDEVIIFAPYFVEYRFYIDNHGGVPVVVKTNDDFTINISRLQEAITEKTKAILINSPNNPTGVVYGKFSLEALGDFLKDKQQETGRTIYLINDDPYRKIVYDGKKSPYLFNFYDNSIIVGSHSKDLAIPGERIGHIAVSPMLSDAEEFIAGATFCNRTLGFVNAPALMQRLVAQLQYSSVDIDWYQKKRDYIYENMSEMGYNMAKPEGAFYFFPVSPIEDDVKFCQFMQQRKVLVVPGSGFGGPGHFRISYCVPMEVIERAMPTFDEAAREFGLY